MSGNLKMSLNLHPILITIDGIKTVLFAGVSWLAGWIAGFAIQSSVPSVEKLSWFEHPAVIAGLVAGVMTVIVTIINRFYQKSDKRTEAEKERANNHTTFSEKMQELAQTQTQISFTELTRLHEREVRVITENAERENRLWKREYSIKSRGEFEGRIRAHAALNEADRLKSHIFKCHKIMSDNNITIPEFQEKSGDEIMAEVAVQMLTFKDDLLDRYERAMENKDE